MSFFDRAVGYLDNLLSQPLPDSSMEESGHTALLEESRQRIQSTLSAIQRGQLIAASSVTENLKNTGRVRGKADITSFSPQAPLSHRDRLQSEAREEIQR
ncbi:MAG: hypothetical protein ACPG80_00150 [Rickettsiales bacterium]